MILMMVMFLNYSIYAIITNVTSCNYNPNNLKPPYDIQNYIDIMSSWVFQVSLQANIACSAEPRTYEIQCWLGVAFIVLTAIVLIPLKYRKYKACLHMEK